jgi:ADP-ribosyl-[dinitrogen reductase] hydrolase
VAERAGQGTDDTDLTWAVAAAYLDGYTLEGAADRMLAWHQTGPRDVGGTTAAALAAYRTSRNARASGAAVADRPMAAGNGSLMRALPTGLVRPDPARRVAEARELSAVTHADRRCVDACVAYCDLTACLLDGAGLPLLPAAKLDTSGYVLATLQVAVWAICQPGTLEDVLVEIVNLGGDADTTGAVAGGLLGARHGHDALPARWVDLLDYRDRILAAAPVLVGLRTASGHPSERP